MLIEVMILLILVACGLSGYRRGLLMSLCTLLILVLCSLGASVAQETLAPKAEAFMEPKVQQVVQQQFQEQIQQGTEQAMEEAGQDEPLNNLIGMLERFGVDVEQQVTQGASAAMQPAVEEASHAVAQAVVKPVAELVVYMAAFLILYLLLHSVALAVNVVDRLPVIHTLNRVGGAVLGVLSGVLLLTVLLVVCQRTGWIPEDAASGPLGLLFEKIVSALV